MRTALLLVAGFLFWPAIVAWDAFVAESPFIVICLADFPDGQAVLNYRQQDDGTIFVVGHRASQKPAWLSMITSQSGLVVKHHATAETYEADRAKIMRILRPYSLQGDGNDNHD